METNLHIYLVIIYFCFQLSFEKEIYVSKRLEK